MVAFVFVCVRALIMTTANIRLCEPCPMLDSDVVRLYKQSFPAQEREPLERLNKLLSEGKLVCHCTLDEQNRLLCFTLVSLAEYFAFLAYMATDPATRSSGIGTQHIKRLIALLKSQFPHHIGLFLEIEATAPAIEVLSDEDRRTRLRRRAFYERAGARVLCQKGYIALNFSDPQKEWEAELLAFEFGQPVNVLKLLCVIRDIYQRFYQIPEDDQLVLRVVENCKAAVFPRLNPGGPHVPQDQRKPRAMWLHMFLAVCITCLNGLCQVFSTRSRPW
jgi:hypothetical protein